MERFRSGVPGFTAGLIVDNPVPTRRIQSFHKAETLEDFFHFVEVHQWHLFCIVIFHALRFL